MTRGAIKIALGVIVAAMGAAMFPSVGPFAFVQILAGGLLVWIGVERLKKESQ